LLITLPLAFGWLHLLSVLYEQRVSLARYWPVTALSLALYLLLFNGAFIYDNTHDRTGEHTVAQVAASPDGATVMLAWGPRYFAVSAAQILQGRLTNLTLIDDKVDFSAIAAQVERGETQLITPEYTLFTQTLD